MAKDKKRKRDLLNKERKGGKESIEDNEILLDVEGQGEKVHFVLKIESYQLDVGKHFANLLVSRKNNHP